MSYKNSIDNRTLLEWLIKLDVWDEYHNKKTVKYLTTAMRCLKEAIQTLQQHDHILS
jgi:hypothetical protein